MIIGVKCLKQSKNLNNFSTNINPKVIAVNYFQIQNLLKILANRSSDTNVEVTCPSGRQASASEKSILKTSKSNPKVQKKSLDIFVETEIRLFSFQKNPTEISIPAGSGTKCNFSI